MAETLDQGRHQPPAQSIDRRAISLWRVSAALQGGLNTAMAVAGAGTLLWLADTPAWLLGTGVALIATYNLVLGVLVIPPLRWRLYRYEVGEDALDIQRGLWVVRRTLVPLIRVQHVDTSQGPLAKYFGLSAVTVSTAATTHEIPALADGVADELRLRIAALARTAREST